MIGSGSWIVITRLVAETGGASATPPPALVTLLFVCFANPIVRVFTQDEAVATYGIQALRIIGSGYIFYGIAMMMTQALNGAGDTETPTWINFFCFWIFQTLLAYFLDKGMDLGPRGLLSPYLCRKHY